MLAGTLGVFMHWAHQAAADSGGAETGGFSPNLIACVAASTITRRCANIAFAEQGRSVTTPDIIARMGFAMDEFFPTGGVEMSMSPRSPKKSPSPDA